MEAAVVGGQHLEGLGGRPVLRTAIVAEQHEGQRTLAKEVAADLQLRQRVPECRTTALALLSTRSLPAASPS